MHVRYGSQRITIGAPSEIHEVAALPLPVLGTIASEHLPLKSAAPQNAGPFHTWEDGQLLMGIATAPCEDASLLQASNDLYNRLFETTKDAFLYRIWNYIPEINSGDADQERYKQFCVGRSASFHQCFGEKEVAYMPAGTCVGTEGDQLAIIFLAGHVKPDHHENPSQTPAYRYPRQFGPRAPSFARATTVEANGQHHRFISGTAAVIGHHSKALGNLAQQVEITCDNLERISAETLASAQYEASEQSLGSGKVYLRHASDYVETHTILKKRFPDIADRLIYLESDICRKELLVEIELSYTDPIKRNPA